MKNLFVCPHCQSGLNPNVKILLVASYGKKRGLVLLSPQPGNYKFIADSSFEDALRPGASLRLFCPVCTEELTSKASEKLVELHLVKPGGEKVEVQFSRAYGVHATFIVDGESVTAYGPDTGDFDHINFFGA